MQAPRQLRGAPGVGASCTAPRPVTVTGGADTDGQRVPEATLEVGGQRLVAGEQIDVDRAGAGPDAVEAVAEHRFDVGTDPVQLRGGIPVYRGLAHLGRRTDPG